MRSRGQKVSALLCGLWVAAALSGCKESATTSAKEQRATSDGPADHDSDTQDVGGVPVQDLYQNPTSSLRYPFVLLHGLGGNKSMGSFVGVKEILEKHGAKVYTAEVSAIGTIEARATQLAVQIDKVLANAEKVHILAHSMGGLDARYLISTLKYGDRVASLTTVGTPHYGTPLADKALQGGGHATALLGMFASVLTGVANSQPNGRLNDALQNLTVAYVTGTFNPQNPDDSRVYYRSVGGVTGEDDKTKLMLRIGALVLKLEQQPSDGLVPLASTKWGKEHAEVHADHLDLVGVHALDGASPFKITDYAESLVADLARRGL